MRIAIVGTGISGLYVAHHLAAEHDLVVFEAEDRPGGHTATVSVEHEAKRYAIDTGFIVFNDKTYPNFVALMDRLGIERQPSNMSFSVRNDAKALAYRASNLNTFFAQRKNLLRPLLYRLLFDIVRFRAALRQSLESSAPSGSLKELLDKGNYSENFIENFVVPMGSAIWSADPNQLLESFPARFFAEFFHNHGFLNAINQPQWQVIKGGSSAYLPALSKPFKDRIRLHSRVERIRRTSDAIFVKSQGQDEERFDKVVIATHSYQALAMLQDPSEQEQTILGAFRYQNNEVVLHTDESLLPLERRAWAAWNYRVLNQHTQPAVVTYWMNLLQGIHAPVNFFVTLNDSKSIDPAKVLARFNYAHPVYTEAAVALQKEQPNLCGLNHTYFCGAYWGYGFHEDGVNSARVVLDALQQRMSA
ncbi:MAG: FAD-dependent oxidoreductase [Myxococcales bacterium]|nr:MAG: FAD-dependent oxidoreductase [Myxococcales bacterium]